MYRLRSGQSEKRSDEERKKGGDRKLDRQKYIVMNRCTDREAGSLRNGVMKGRIKRETES